MGESKGRKMTDEVRSRVNVAYLGQIWVFCTATLTARRTLVMGQKARGRRGDPAIRWTEELQLRLTAFCLESTRARKLEQEGC